MGVCIRNSPSTAPFRTGGGLAPDSDPRPVGLIPPDSLVIAAIDCAGDFAQRHTVPIGMNIWAGLAIIITVWTGIQMMFSGGLAIGEVVSLILLLGFPYAVLVFYTSTAATPWGPMSFIEMIYGMGREISARLVDGVFTQARRTLTAVWGQIWATEVVRDTVREVEAESWWRRIIRGAVTVDFGLGEAFREFMRFLRGLWASVQLFTLLGLLVLLLVVPLVVAYCSYLWGYLSVAVAVILGPLLIPWILVPQLQFLAWGWFRSLLGAAVHMMVAGATFAVVAQMLMIPLVRFGTLMAEQQEAGFFSFTTILANNGPIVVLVESLPLILIAYLGAFKVGEITAMIMNGGSMPGSGIGDRMRSVGSMGRLGRSGAALGRGAASMGGGGGGRLAAAAAGGGAGVAVVAAAQVLSQSSKRS